MNTLIIEAGLPPGPALLGANPNGTQGKCSVFRDWRVGAPFHMFLAEFDVLFTYSISISYVVIYKISELTIHATLPHHVDMEGLGIHSFVYSVEVEGDEHPHLCSYVHERNMECSACLYRLAPPCHKYGGGAPHHICRWWMGSTSFTNAQQSGDGGGWTSIPSCAGMQAFTSVPVPD